MSVICALSLWSAGRPRASGSFTICLCSGPMYPSSISTTLFTALFHLCLSYRQNCTSGTTSTSGSVSLIPAMEFHESIPHVLEHKTYPSLFLPLSPSTTLSPPRMHLVSNSFQKSFLIFITTTHQIPDQPLPLPFSQGSAASHALSI